MEFLAPEWHRQLPSTSTVLLERLRQGEVLPSGFVLAAHEQTEGRGRHGRRWLSGPDRDLTFSVLLRPATDLPQLLSLPMAVSLALAAAVAGRGVQARTKWPNDVLVGGRKLAGVLTERDGERVVVGIGLNVNASAEDLAEVGQPATSLCLETGRQHGVELILAEILLQLARWTRLWEDQGFAGLRSAWMGHCVGVGAPVTIRDGAIWRRGLLLGFGRHGELLLGGVGTEPQPIWSGEIETWD